jgi:phage-related protein
MSEKQRSRKKWTVGFFEDRRGSRPVQEYLAAITDVTDLSHILLVIQRLSILGQSLLETKQAKHIEGDIYELRPGRHRILYAQDGNRFVLLSAFIKKTDKTPRSEIDNALSNYREYQNTGGFFEQTVKPI